MEPQPTSPTSKFHLPRLPQLSGRAKTIIALAVIAVAVVLAFYAPPEGDSDNITGDEPSTPTVTITNVVSSIPLKQQAMLNGMQLTLTQAVEASKFSDDRRPGGNYVIRVQVVATNTLDSTLGVNYESLVRLQLPDGTMVAPKYISVHPSSLPKSTQNGYFDFPVSAPIPLSALILHLGNGETVAFS
jgi:hypothetical protein